MLADFINMYGMELLYAVITALAGYIGIAVKNVYTKYINDKTKQDVARTAVRFVEQVYKDLHGDDKLTEAFTAAAEMLREKSIYVSELELRVLLEAAVAEFNEAFKGAE